MTDLQDPLPEAKWTWRRVFVWFVNLTTALAVGWIIWKLEGHPRELLHLSFALLARMVVNDILYLVAPSADHIVRMVQEAKVRRAGIAERVTPSYSRLRPDDPEGDL